MRQPARRFGILVLAVALIPGQFSTADAGVIPWLYDAVFGPVGHYGYGGYGYGGYAYRYPYAAPQVSYAMPAVSPYRAPSNCGPSGCGTAGCAVSSYAVPSYSVGYRPLFIAPAYCSTGGCSTVSSGWRYAAGNCGTCSVTSSSSACSAKTAWKSEKSESKEAKTEWETEVIRSEAAVPTPATKDEAPVPQKTFADEPADPSKGQPAAVEKVVADGGAETGNEASAEANPADPNWTETGKPAAEIAAEAEVANEGSAGDAAVTGAGAEAAAASVEEGATEEAGSGKPDAGFGETLRGVDEDVNQIFSEPVKGVEAVIEGEGTPAVTTPVLPEGLETLPEGLEGLPEVGPTLNSEEALPLELEEKSSWKFETPVRRIAFRAGFRRATVARTSVSVDVDYVLPSTATLRLVSR